MKLWKKSALLVALINPKRGDLDKVHYPMKYGDSYSVNKTEESLGEFY